MEIKRKENQVEIKCIKCNKWIYAYIKKDKKLEGVIVSCKCGCIQKCIREVEENTYWRVINPFS